MAEAEKIYKNKGKKLAQVEKRRKIAEKRAIKREKQRQDLHFVLGGDRGEAEEHKLKNTLLMRTMKTRAVDARASLMRKQNDELDRFEHVKIAESDRGGGLHKNALSLFSITPPMIQRGKHVTTHMDLKSW